MAETKKNNEKRPGNSKLYLAWIRKQNCIRCGHPAPSEPHHIKHVGHFSGIGMKAIDLFAMPVCRNCHQAIHNDPGYWQDQTTWVLRTIEKAVKQEPNRENSAFLTGQTPVT